MSIIDKIFCFASRYVLIALVALTGFAGSSANAQAVAPQLLPYSVKVIAGGGTTATFTAGTAGGCPVSGYTPTDTYGDGCLATEIELTGPRTAVVDVNGNVFFTDYTNGLIRRVDAISGVVTAVAGGVSQSASPASGADCVAGSSATTASDAKGDGCLGTQVYLANPVGLVFSPAGDLYFSEIGNTVGGTTYEQIFGADVRKIAATKGLITTTGVISTADGYLSSYYNAGYSADNFTASPACSTTVLTNCILAASQSYLYEPFGLAFDNSGNLYIAEEYKEAVLVVNTNATQATTVTGVTIPPGTVAKIAGATTAGSSTCPNGDSGTTGCNYPATGGKYTPGALANVSMIDAPFGVAVDPSGNVYFSDEFLYNVPEIIGGTGSTAGEIELYAGTQDTEGKNAAPVTVRGVAGSFGIGNPHGVAADSLSNVYLADGYAGVIWRVDSAGKLMYAVAGGAATVCTASIVPGVTTIDSYGDGCPATSAKFGTGTTGGVFGVSVDAYSDLFTGDTVSGLVREVASGTQFGPIGANQPTQYVDIHFAAGDGPEASLAYTLTTGTGNFVFGNATCTTNSDTTKDCVLPIKATPSVLGPFTGTLQVTSVLGGVASFPLAGDFVASPLTRTVVTAAQAANCANTTAYSNTTPVILTATVTTSGANPPGGTVTFYANGSQIGSPVNVNSNAASLTYTFSTTGSPYAITAVYSGDSYYKTSTSGTDTITSSTPSFSGAAISSQQNTVAPGQTALYSFTLQQNVYAGTLTFACSGLPANSSCSFYPASLTASGCQVSNTVAMSIITQASAQTIAASSLGGEGRGWRLMLGILPGLGLALLIGLRRRKAALRYGRVWMALALLLAAFGIASCNGNVAAIPATPAGTYTVTVTITGSAGTSSSFTVPLIVQ
ncbi:MAG: Ig-like domain repeat protein [Terracidiphilus sp.]